MKRLVTIFLLLLQFSLFAQNDFEWAIEPKYTNVGNFKNGFATAKKNKHWGIIDKNDNQILAFHYDTIVSDEYNRFFICKNKKWGVFSNSRIKLNPIFDVFFYILENNYIIFKNNNSFGLINKQYKVIAENYDYIQINFYADIADISAWKNDTVYSLDTIGRVIEVRFQPLHNYNKRSKNYLDGFNWIHSSINYGGQPVMYDFGNILQLKNNKDILIPKPFSHTEFIDNESLLPFHYIKSFTIEEHRCACDPPYDEIEYVKIPNIFQEFGFINSNNQVIIKPVFESVKLFSENLCAVKYNGKWGYIKNPLIYPPNKTSSKKIVKTGNDYSVFFSVNNYNDLVFRSLTNPIGDAEKLAKSINTIFGFDTLIYRNLTKVEIQKALSDLRKKNFGKDDQLLIYLSGHGVATNKGYFVPTDGIYNDEFGNSYYSYRDLEIDITSIPCNHILVIIDACHSSTFNKDISFGNLLAENKGTYQRPNELSEIQKFVNKTLQFKSRLVITTGMDVTFDNSAFTNLFLQKFGSFVSLNAEPVLTYDELKSYIEKNFANSDFRSFEGHEEGGSFLFIVK